MANWKTEDDVSEKQHPESIDVTFSVPFVHRLRVTDDVVGDDFDQLIEVLDVGETGTAKVLVVAEESLSQPAKRLSDRFQAASQIDLIGQPELVVGGEDVKNSTDATKQVLRRINDGDLDRRSYVIAIGGGAMLDAVGYAAAVAFINVSSSEEGGGGGGGGGG